VIAARDGQEALHAVQADSPDVVFLDIWIPGIDGMQTLRAIKRIAPHCSVIMMSGHGTIETAVKAIKLGATDYLEKPLNLEDVLHLVQKAITNRSAEEKTYQGHDVAAVQLIGASEKAAGLRRALEKAAAKTGTVWLCGGKGTGKEYLARIIHHLEGKDRGGLVKVNCSDLIAETMDETLLGKQDGSVRPRPGKIHQARGGTLLLVRVDRLDKALAPRLTEILSGPAKTGAVSEPGQVWGFRVVSTSVKSPEELVREDSFPPILTEVLAQRVIRVPSLRERAEDIPLFVDHFLREAVAEFDRDIKGTDIEAMQRLLSYPWPGNVKELKILIEHVVMTAPGPLITTNDLLIPVAGDFATQADSTAGPVTVVSGNGAVSPRDRLAGDIAAAEPGLPVPPAAFRHQTTLRGRVVMYGQGLHTGNKTGLILSPLPPSSGIMFGHITSGGTVSALLDNVESTDFCTSLRRNGSPARTIEHLMAVFHVYGLTNVLVKISGEVPIMDGSALEFCNLVESGEIIPQEELIEEVRISQPIALPFPDGNPKRMTVEPSDRLEVEYHLDYPPPVGKMTLLFSCDSPEAFKEQIAPARTFGFVKDMRMMDEMGLAGGGRLSNVVLLDEEKVVNPPLRFPDEFVRHKILDIIGDFYLLGRPFIGKIVAHQTGHTDNFRMMKLIREKLGMG